MLVYRFEDYYRGFFFCKGLITARHSKAVEKNANFNIFTYTHLRHTRPWRFDYRIPI